MDPILSRLLDQIATRFQRLYLCFRDRAFQWDNSQYCTTKVEGTGSEKSKMAAYTTEMHISQLPDQITTRFQCYTCVFRVEHSNGTICNTLQQKWKEPEVKNPRWRPIPLKCIYLSSQTRQKRSSNGYSYVSGSVIPLERYVTLCNQSEGNRRWKIQDFSQYH